MKLNKLTAALLAVIMLMTSLSAAAFVPRSAAEAPEDDEFKVVVSVEGLTLGQGIYAGPKAYTLDEINALIEGNGYGPYTEDNITAAMATLAFLNDYGIDWDITGRWESGAYISALKDLDTHELNVPSVITEHSGLTSEDIADGNDDEWLGEFDYNWMAGWMITANDFMITESVSSWKLKEHLDDAGVGGELGNTCVVRWQFTLSGYGADLGAAVGWSGTEPYFEGARKAPLYAAYALCDDEEARAEALTVMETLDAPQEEVDAAAAKLKAASEKPQPEKKDYSAILQSTLEQLPITFPEPKFNAGGGEWAIIALARGGGFPLGDRYFEDYYARAAETVVEKAAAADMNGAIDKTKSTENARLIMALSAIGKDSRNVGGVDLVAAFGKNDFDGWVCKNINGAIYTLIALDTWDFETENADLREKCVNYILGKEINGGGWALTGSSPDPDVTAMALQALSNYGDNKNVADAADRAFSKLSAMQKDDGCFASWGTVNAESAAQVIIACTAWDINPDSDPRFIKGGLSVVDALLSFYIEDSRSFAHTVGGKTNAMATNQAVCALAAYDRFVKGESRLYDMKENLPNGDVNGDGEVTAQDALALIRCVLGTNELDAAKRNKADVNHDGRITLSDALLTLRTAMMRGNM